jgi:hypothetical protein
VIIEPAGAVNCHHIVLQTLNRAIVSCDNSVYLIRFDNWASYDLYRFERKTKQRKEKEDFD